MLEFFTTKNIQTVIDGCLGGLTFGIYSSIVTQRQLEEFNKKIELEKKILYEKHKEDIKMILERIEKLENNY